MRVPLILKDIESRTEDLTERETITNIIEAEEASLRELDDKMKWLKNFERLLEIQRNIQWPPVIDIDPKVFVPEVSLLLVDCILVCLDLRYLSNLSFFFFYPN
jgi:hypothetical protein